MKWDLLERKERLQLEKCSGAQKPVAPQEHFYVLKNFSYTLANTTTTFHTHIPSISEDTTVISITYISYDFL
jgi:hypothetical protein